MIDAPDFRLAMVALLQEAIRHTGLPRAHQAVAYYLKTEQIVLGDALCLSGFLAQLAKDPNVTPERTVTALGVIRCYLSHRYAEVLRDDLPEALRQQVDAWLAAQPDAVGFAVQISTNVATTLEQLKNGTNTPSGNRMAMVGASGALRALPAPSTTAEPQAPTPAPTTAPLPTQVASTVPLPGPGRRHPQWLAGVLAGLTLLGLGGYWGAAWYQQDRPLDAAALSDLLPVRSARLRGGQVAVIELGDASFKALPAAQQEQIAGRLLERLGARVRVASLSDGQGLRMSLTRVLDKVEVRDEGLAPPPAEVLGLPPSAGGPGR